jgi:tetratricopeptide (TPR) repeat protein
MLKSLVGFFLFLTSAVFAESSANVDLARAAFDRAHDAFLRHTIVDRLPVVAVDPSPRVVPFWPDVSADLQESRDFTPLGDAEALEGFLLLHEGRLALAKATLQRVWADRSWFTIGELTVGRAYLQTLLWLHDDERLQSAWKLWQNKYLSPESLLIGIESYERTQPSLALQILKQAIELYPDDRRFLGELTLFSQDFPQTEALWQQTEEQNLGWSRTLLARLLRRIERLPDAQARRSALGVLTSSGVLVAPELETFLQRDYGASVREWLKKGPVDPVADGRYSWDVDENGWPNAQLFFRKGKLVSWSTGFLDAASGFWEAHFSDGRLTWVRENKGDESWSLKYSVYPYVDSLTWRNKTQTFRYTFQPFVTTAEPYTQDQLKKLPEALWPWYLSTSWKPLNPAKLVPQALRLDEFTNGVWSKELFLLKGEVWLEIADTLGDGKPDTWSYFRNGRLASVYRNFGETGQPDLHAIYDRGKLVASEASPQGKGVTEFVLYPQQGVQLWDWDGTGTALLRVFQWKGATGLKASVFSHSNLPFQDMPRWETPPWH